MKTTEPAAKHCQTRWLGSISAHSLAALLFGLLLLLFPGVSDAESGRFAMPQENVHADVSTRVVEIASNFTGTEIIVFGAIENARIENAVAKQYDIVVVVEGVSSPLILRRKERVAGVWLNTRTIRFDAIPSYYAISSTRPLDEFTTSRVLNLHAIGFEHISIIPAEMAERRADKKDELAAFKSAIVRLKRKQGLYVEDKFGTVFLGTSLFRTSIDLPANVPVGPLTARVHLFRDGILLDTFTSTVQLTREGLGRFIYNFAHGYPLFYGIFTVLLSAGAGWIASTYFSRRTS